MTRTPAAAPTRGPAADDRSPGLDRLTAMATRLLGVPIALATVIEPHRQRVLSGRGLREPWASMGHTPLTHSLCRFVVEAGTVLVVSDARLHPLLRNSLAIPDLQIVAYAGYPLAASDGTPIGAFCAADTRPRQWEADELLLLKDLAAIAATEITGQMHAARLSEANRQVAEATRRAEEHEAFLEALLDSLDSGVAACDTEGRLVLFNRALQRALDHEADPSLTPMEWASRLRVLHPDGRPFTAAEMPVVRALRGECVRDIDNILVNESGRRRWFVSHGNQIRSRSGVLLGAVATAHDITERRLAERFRDTELAVHRIFATADDLAEAAPEVLKVIAVTLGWVHAELWLADELTDRLLPAGSWTGPDHPVPVHVPAGLDRGYGLAGVAWGQDAPVWVPDLAVAPAPLTGDAAARYRLRAALSVPVHGGDRAIGALTVFASTTGTQDASCIALLAGIAAQVGEFQQRRRAEDLHRQLARSQDEYIALAGHELRTPLTSMLAATTLLLDAEPDTPVSEVLDLVGLISRKGDDMRAVIDGLLDLAALDSGHTGLDRQRVDLAAVVREALDAVSAAAAGLGVTFHPVLPAELPVQGCPLRLRQLADNLLGNAVKYSPEGGRVDVLLEHRAGVAHLRITDSGIGIPDNDRDHVFRRFYRSPQAVQHAIPGSGLGLALCSAIAARHHGRIALGPAGGQGTAVVVRLPAD
ncbi:ATP-binding protein [Actinoplanes sp. NPDC023801]|uniref:sensor histidine kinase n=1 Tax=Actinoplanes sp. NPDC023801 TaxID=3154595 RepID=UPI0033C8FC8B